MIKLFIIYFDAKSGINIQSNLYVDISIQNLLGDDIQQIHMPIIANVGVYGLREIEGTDSAIINLSRIPCYDIL